MNQEPEHRGNHRAERDGQEGVFHSGMAHGGEGERHGKRSAGEREDEEGPRHSGEASHAGDHFRKEREPSGQGDQPSAKAFKELLSLSEILGPNETNGGGSAECPANGVGKAT